jgi:hypothetical protein
MDSRVDETRHHFEAVAERMDSRVDETRHHFEAVAERMDSRVDETRHHFDVVAEGMRADARLVADESRRHFDVVAEGMRADVRLVAEGVSSLAERVDRVEHNLREEIRETRRDLTALLTASYTDLDRRVRRLEGD